jgi:hypothetical protein
VKRLKVTEDKTVEYIRLRTGLSPRSIHAVLRILSILIKEEALSLPESTLVDIMVPSIGSLRITPIPETRIVSKKLRSVRIEPPRRELDIVPDTALEHILTLPR